MKRLICTALFLCLAAPVLAGYNYITPDTTRANLEKGAPMNIVDIQVKEGYEKGHLKGAMETNAYPVKSDAERARLDPVLPTLAANEDPVVVVCPRGKGGAERTVDYLEEKGVASARIFILEGGQEGWPFDAETGK